MNKIHLVLILFFISTSASLAQSDTIIIYKVNYVELNIPAGWEEFILKTEDSLLTFYEIEPIDTAFSEMLSIDPNDRMGLKLIKDLTKWKQRTTKTKPLQYKDIGLLYVRSYRIIGKLTIGRLKAVYIDDVEEYSETDIDIEDLKLILRRFD